MHKARDFAGRFMHITDRLRPLLGPADHGDPTTPVLHRHDDDEASGKELASFRIRSDSAGHRYAVRKSDFPSLAPDETPPATARTAHGYPEGAPDGHAA